MKQELKIYLAGHGILVAGKQPTAKEAAAAAVALGQLFGVHITAGADFASVEMISLLSEVCDISVPEPFYRGFPDSVRALTPEELLYDQLLHYAVTYRMGHFEETGHSTLEAEVARVAYNGELEQKPFRILREAEATVHILALCSSMLAATRPLAEEDYKLLCTVIDTYGYEPSTIACHDTAIRLLCDLRDLSYARFLSMSDVLKLAERLNAKKDRRATVYRLALPSADRRLIAKTLDAILAEGRCELALCYERKKAFCGLLHHIHYVPRCELGREFVSAMRSKGNRSVMSGFERALAAGDISAACRVLLEGKGGSALLRNLNFILSRAKTEEDVIAVLSHLPKADPTVYIQLLLQFSSASLEGRRAFTFAKRGRLITHTESEEECERRRSRISPALAELTARLLRRRLQELLGGRLGKVYIAPGMDRMAIPVSESTANLGYGVLAKGSRLPIPEGRFVRAFTYWEKVDDIDLSLFLLEDSGREEEFSWRTMARNGAAVITYSGDQTSGYQGGSEYYDIDLEAVKRRYPDAHYIILCSNVYSDKTYDRCLCRAGYMMREGMDGGEVYEPRTVRSSFRITCESTEAYLFGIDIRTRELVWLNASSFTDRHVAGEGTHAFLDRYFRATEILSLDGLYRMLASEVVSTPEEADVLLLHEPPAEPTEAEVVLPYEFPHILSHLAPRK